MIVYREAEDEPADPRALLADHRARALGLAGGAAGPTHDDATGLLIDLGVLESAVADALCPEADEPSPATDALGRASLAAGHLFRRTWRGEPGAGPREAARAVAAALDGVGALPPRVGLRAPEGYAYYALYPETYLAAAERLAASLGPGPVVCLGLRSIGASLSAVVAAALEAAGRSVETLTLRPRGHPFDRRPVPGPALAEALRARKGGRFLIVDEGPGLSGSSFAGVARWLVELGAREDRIVLFPSHLPDPGAFRSEAARAIWPRLASAHAPFEKAWLPRAPFPPGSRDLAGGAWRGFLGLPEAEWPAVDPRHERRKYLAAGPDGGLVLHKFVGLGRFGARAHARAEGLGALGLAPPALGLAGGFLAQAFVPGRPLGAADADVALVRMAGRYLGHVALAYATGRPARPEALLEMVRVNVAEGLGEDWSATLEARARGLGEAPAVAVDGRVLPHEWLRTPDGHLKADGIDHHADHFFPGYADIAWDVAGFGEEFGLGERALGELAAEVRRRAGDQGDLARRLPFYRVAYLAFRLGYAIFAAETLGGAADGRRMAGAAASYRGRLASAVRRLAASPP